MRALLFGVLIALGTTQNVGSGFNVALPTSFTTQATATAQPFAATAQPFSQPFASAAWSTQATTGTQFASPSSPFATPTATLASPLVSSPQISISLNANTLNTVPKKSKKTATTTATPLSSASLSASPSVLLPTGGAAAAPVGQGAASAAEANAYDQTKFRSFNMAMTPTNVALMNKDPKQELKVHCDFTSDYLTPQAQVVSSPNVGCGYKGSVGSLRICFDANNKFDPNSCRKASYKIDATSFNPNSQDQILGLKRLLFHGCPADWSMMAERLCYNLLGQWGIAAPEATHAVLYENGQSLGVFAFVECVDDMFTQQHFGNDYNQGNGALYKEAWFNPVHMANLSATFKYGKRDDAFMYEIESVMLATPLTASAATAFFNEYFDTQSIVDVTAANTVLGNTDDWRQRHNLFWYIREDAQGKKAVLIPWDYDRIDDPGADTRGALHGKPWWDPSTEIGCSNRIRTPAERGAITGRGDPVQDAYWADIYANYPADVEIPVSCDHITQLMALALGPRIRQRTRELAGSLNRQAMQANVQTWTAQIQTALARDPDGPQYQDMLSEQSKLIDWIFKAAQKAVTDANAGDSGMSSPAPVASTATTSSDGTTFVPLSSAKQGVSDAGAAFFKFKPGQVISSTFTPVGGGATTSVSYSPQTGSFSSAAFPQSFSQPSFTQPSLQQASAPRYTQPSFSATPTFSAAPSFSASSFSTPSFSTMPSFAWSG